MKLQAAMEYLNTYMWAILIIAVVLVVMIKLNLFNPNFWAAKQQTGACDVIRIQYGGTTLHCSGGALIPEFVAQFGGSGWIAANGFFPQYTSITYGCCYNNQLNGMTVSLWMYVPSSAPQMEGNLSYTSEWGEQINANTMTGKLVIGGTMGSWISSQSTFDQWHFVVMTAQNNVGEYLYIDGKLVNSISSNTFLFTTEPINGEYQLASIGGAGPPRWPSKPNFFFSGMISNVQIYNASLSANQIQSLYLEGIGGAPINLQHLSAWWPLNGNTNDYSGYGNNGAAWNVIFTDNWYGNYAQP